MSSQLKQAFVQSVRASRLIAKGYLQIKQHTLDLDDVEEHAPRKKREPKKKLDKVESLLAKLSPEQLDLFKAQLLKGVQ